MNAKVLRQLDCDLACYGEMLFFLTDSPNSFRIDRVPPYSSMSEIRQIQERINRSL